MVMGPTPPGTGGDRTRRFFDGLEVHVADQLALAARRFRLKAIDSHVDYRGARFDPIGGDHARATDGGDQDVGLAADRGQITGARMRDGHRAVRAQEQLRHRLADDVGAAEYDSAQAGEIAQAILQQHQAAQRRAGHQRVLARRQPTRVDDMKPVDVLGRVDGVDHRGGVDLRRQRQLDQDAMNGWVAIQPFDQGQQIVLTGFDVQPVFETAHPDLQGLAGLVAHIDFAGRIVADQDHGQAGLQTLERQLCHLVGDFGPKPGRKGLAVDDLCCCHACHCPRCRHPRSFRRLCR